MQNGMVVLSQKNPVSFIPQKRSVFLHKGRKQLELAPCSKAAEDCVIDTAKSSQYSELFIPENIMGLFIPGKKKKSSTREGTFLFGVVADNGGQQPAKPTCVSVLSNRNDWQKKKKQLFYAIR